MIPSLIIAYVLYPKIIPDTLITGIAMFVIGIAYFSLSNYINPNYLEDYWSLELLPIKQVYYGVPLMDIVWFFWMGLFSRMLLSVWIVLHTKPNDRYEKMILNTK